MVADGEDGAEVDLAANSKDQAKIAFEFCNTFANQIDKKGKYFHCLRDNIFYKPNKVLGNRKMLNRLTQNWMDLMPLLELLMNITQQRIVRYMMLSNHLWV